MSDIKVTISALWAQHLYQGCTPDYIKAVCRGKCCWVGEGKNAHSDVYVAEKHQSTLVSRGATFRENGIMEDTEEGRCRFQEHGFCSLQQWGLKPRACYVSPWVLSKNNVLGMSVRFTRLKCHKEDHRRLPAHKVFSSGLCVLFGDEEAARISEHFTRSDKDYLTRMPNHIAMECWHVAGLRKELAKEGE